jgi:hypothetical protein
VSAAGAVAGVHLARQLTGAIHRGPIHRGDGAITGPARGSATVSHRSDLGPTPCGENGSREPCRNPFEVLRP